MSKQNLTLEDKRRLAKELLEKKKRKAQSDRASMAKNYRNYTYDMFMQTMGAKPAEATRFSEWVEGATQDKIYAFESARLGAQTTEVEIERETGERMKLLNLSSYNYLGFGYHPEVIKAAQDAVAKYGLGASSSPVISGTYTIHRQLEENLVSHFGMPDRAVSLFSSGYAVNLGTIQAFCGAGSHIILDSAAHMSILEGARYSGAELSYFRHNDVEHLSEILEQVATGNKRILVCAEGVYSADGDYGNLADIVKVCKKYGAYVLVDEAHSVLVAGQNGRGVCEEQGVLRDVDFYVMTFSKGFGGVGGAVLAKKELVRYINWYAKCRMFSCALDPAVTGGMVKVLELASSPEGNRRRKRIKENAKYLKAALEGKVNLGVSDSWISTVIFGSEKNTLPLNDFLQRNGLDTSIMQFPAAPKNEARIRMFVTSEHTEEQLDRVAHIVLKAGAAFNFLIQ